MTEQGHSPEEERNESPREVVVRLLSAETAELAEIRRSVEAGMEVEKVREIRGQYQNSIEQLEGDHDARTVCGMVGSALILIKCGDPENNLRQDVEDLVGYLDQIGWTDDADVLWRYLRGEEVKSESF